MILQISGRKDQKLRACWVTLGRFAYDEPPADDKDLSRPADAIRGSGSSAVSAPSATGMVPVFWAKTGHGLVPVGLGDADVDDRLEGHLWTGLEIDYVEEFVEARSSSMIWETACARSSNRSPARAMAASERCAASGRSRS